MWHQVNRKKNMGKKKDAGGEPSPILTDIAPVALSLIVVVLMAILFAVFHFTLVQNVGKEIQSAIESGVRSAGGVFTSTFAEVAPIIEKFASEGSLQVATIENSVETGVTDVIKISDAMLAFAVLEFENGTTQLTAFLQNAIQSFFEILSVWTSTFLNDVKFLSTQLQFMVETLNIILTPVEWIINALNAIIHLFQ